MHNIWRQVAYQREKEVNVRSLVDKESNGMVLYLDL